MEERYFLRTTYADGRETTEYMEMEAAYHRMPQIMTEELLARHKGAEKYVVRVCWGIEHLGLEQIKENCEF